MKRETRELLAGFSKVLVQNLRRKTSVSKDPMRHASFKVLKQTHAPSVLIELGYLSNAEDERLLASSEWQRQVAAAIAASVETFFAKRALTHLPHDPHAATQHIHGPAKTLYGGQVADEPWIDVTNCDCDVSDMRYELEFGPDDVLPHSTVMSGVPPGRGVQKRILTEPVQRD